MRLEYIELENFKAIESARIALDGKSTVFFGINGTGKSTILRSISLLYANIINQIVNRKELRQSYAIQLEDIQHGKKETKINALIALENEKILYHRGMTRSTGKKEHNIQSLKLIADIFHEKYITDEKQRDIPIFVNIPLPDMYKQS